MQGLMVVGCIVDEILRVGLNRVHTGFIQARPSKIHGLFKDFSRTNLTIFKDLGWML